MKSSEYWSRNPLHIVESPLNLSGKARRGLTGGGGWFGMFTGISSWVAAGAGGDKLSPCRDRTNSSVSAVKRVSWCWWMASWFAWAESSDVSCVKAAGSRCGEVFCDETEAWGSICSLLNNSKQYRTQVMDGQRVGAGGRQIRVDGQFRRSRQVAGIVIGETIRVIHRQAEQQGINAQKWSPGQIKTSHWGAGTTVFYGEWCECVYWWQVQTISPRYVGGESNELVIRRGLPLVVWERRCKGLICNSYFTIIQMFL